MCYWEHKKMLRADVSTQEQYYIKDWCVTGSTRQFWGPMCQPIVLHAKEEAGAFNGVSYAACGAHLGGHPNWKPSTAGTRQISSPICVSVPREVARTVFGTGPTSTWSSGRIMPRRLGLCTWARCEEVPQWCNLQTVYMTTWDLTQCFAILNNVMFYETSWVVQL